MSLPVPRMASAEFGFMRPVAGKGGRVWVFRQIDGSGIGDMLVTMPGEAGEAATILAPVGFGRSLVAKKTLTGWQGFPNREPAAADRWRPAGKVAAWFHEIGAPMFPAPSAVVAAAMPEPDPGHGRIVVLSGTGIRANVLKWAVNGFGFEIILDPENNWALLSGKIGEFGHGFPSVRWMQLVERIACKLRPTVRDLRIGVCNGIGPAVAVAAATPVGWIGVAAPGTEADWAAESAGPVGIDTMDHDNGNRSARWKGPAIPDVDGVVSLIRGLVAMINVPATAVVRVGLHGERGFAFVKVEGKNTTPQQWGSKIAVGAIEHFFQCGAITALSVTIVNVPVAEGTDGEAA